MKKDIEVKILEENLRLAEERLEEAKMLLKKYYERVEV